MENSTGLLGKTREAVGKPPSDLLCKPPKLHNRNRTEKLKKLIQKPQTSISKTRKPKASQDIQTKSLFLIFAKIIVLIFKSYPGVLRRNSARGLEHHKAILSAFAHISLETRSRSSSKSEYRRWFSSSSGFRTGLPTSAASVRSAVSLRSS